MKHKKFNSIVLTILIALSALTIQPTKALASESSTFSASFSGIYDDSDSAMDFDIYSIDKENQTFSGHIMIDYYADTLNQDVSGKISLNEDNYVCEFTFKYVCWFVKYDATFTLTINPFTGVVTGLGGGGALIYSTSIYLTGTNVGIGKDDTLFALVDGTVKFEKMGKDRKKVSVYPVEQ